MEKQSRIRVKSLAWIEDGNALFVVKMFDTVKNEDYYRPVGGTVEFGELAIVTVHREVLEEMNTNVEVFGEPLILENLFTCDGEPGHEIVYLYPSRFVDPTFYQRKIYQLTEADGSHWPATWVKVEDCLNENIRLVPEALLDWYKTHFDATH